MDESTTLKTGVKGGGARILRVLTHALCSRLINRPEYVRLYARELFAMGLAGEGGLTRAERQAMAAHWAQRADEEEREEREEREAAAAAAAMHIGVVGAGAKAKTGATSSSSSSPPGRASRDAKALAIWLDSGGTGGASGGHVATRVAVMCLAHSLAKGEPPVGWMQPSSSSSSSSSSSRDGGSSSHHHSAEHYARSKTLADEARELARDTYRMHALGALEELLRVGLSAVSGQAGGRIHMF